MKPVVGKVPASVPAPKLKTPAPKRRWRFSFRYWRQVEYFGVGDVEPKWFVALLERLKDLSDTTLEEIVSNPVVKLAWRYHAIDWALRNVPMAKADFNWVPADYLNNDVEHPFVQFHISKALGRVIGFWDEEDTFNILLLDPMHNLQPSKHNDYNLRDTQVGDDAFAGAIQFMEQRIALCEAAECQCRGAYAAIQANLTSGLPFNGLLVALTTERFGECTAHVASGLADSIADILEIGLDSLRA